MNNIRLLEEQHRRHAVTIAERSALGVGSAWHDHRTRQMQHEGLDWLYLALSGATYGALVWGAVWLHAAVSAGVL